MSWIKVITLVQHMGRERGVRGRREGLLDGIGKGNRGGGKGRGDGRRERGFGEGLGLRLRGEEGGESGERGIGRRDEGVGGIWGNVCCCGE